MRKEPVTMMTTTAGTPRTLTWTTAMVTGWYANSSPLTHARGCR